MDRYQRIDATIIKGYELIQANDSLGGCKKWLEAWEEIKGLFAEGVAEDVFELNDKYKWKLPISNLVQFLEMELHNAGIDDITYHHKRMVFCRELIQWCKDDLTIYNTRIGMAEAYFDIGDIAAGDQIFKEWLSDDPDCGMGYSGWADCYRLTFDDRRYEKAEEILLAGYARTGLRDKHCVVEGLVNLYHEIGKLDEAQKYAKLYPVLHPAELTDTINAAKPASATVQKTGRNESCPCGSGKKYKKCCGA